MSEKLCRIIEIRSVVTIEIEKKITILENFCQNFKGHQGAPKIYHMWGKVRLTFSDKNFENPFSRFCVINFLKYLKKRENSKFDSKRF